MNGFNTGNRLSVQTDQNPNSSTYGSTRTRLIYDTTNCPLDTTAAWTEISYVCEQQDGFNTGNTIITERDVNPGSVTYNETRTRTVSDDPRCVRDTNPNWVVQSRVCDVDSNGDNTGFATITELDTNPFSSTYNTTRTRQVFSYYSCHNLSYTTKEYMGSVSGNGTPQRLACDGDSTLHKSQRLATTAYNYYIVVGDCVTTIEDACYRRPQNGSISLMTVYLPYTITEIGYEAFYNVHCLSEVYIEAITPPTIGERAFMYEDLTNYRVLPLCPIYVPPTSVEAYKTAWPQYASVIRAIPS